VTSRVVYVVVKQITAETSIGKSVIIPIGERLEYDGTSDAQAIFWRPNNHSFVYRPASEAKKDLRPLSE